MERARGTTPGALTVFCLLLREMPGAILPIETT